jgi:GINS complex subunit 2
MVLSKLLFSHASEDMPHVEEIKTLIKDIFDIRQAKLRTAIDSILTSNTQTENSNKVSFDNLTILEINTTRPFLPYATDLIARLERVAQLHTSSLNNTTHSSHNFSSSNY